MIFAVSDCWCCAQPYPGGGLTCRRGHSRAEHLRLNSSYPSGVALENAEIRAAPGVQKPAMVLTRTWYCPRQDCHFPSNKSG